MTRTLGWMVIATLALTALAPGSASAQGGFYLGAGLGPAARIDDWPTQFRLEQELGYYFDGRPEGFFLGFTPSQSFSDHFWILTFAPRAGYMFGLFRGDGFAFQLGPTGTVGLGVAGCYGDSECDADAYFHFSVALMLRLLLADETVALYVRPLEFEFAFGDGVDGGRDRWDDHAVRYVLAGGVQFHL